MIDEDYEDLENCDDDIDDVDSEIDDSMGGNTRGRPEGYIQRKVVLQFNSKCRARFTEGDPNIVLEVKGSNTENYRNEGYFGEMYYLIKNIIKINVKEKLFNKSEMVNIYDMMDILKQSDKDAKEQAKNVIQAINNNEVVSSICQDGIDRCKVK